jgi:transcriptional regulator with XRE-family HTH domain
MHKQKLKMIRDLKNLSQDDVASYLGIKQNSLSRREKNPSKLKAEEAEKLAELYEISVADLLSKEKPVVSFTNNPIQKTYIPNQLELEKETFEKLLTYKNAEICLLRETLEYFQKQNQQLMELLSKK